MNNILHKAAALFFSGILSLSLLAGCAGTPPASSNASASSASASASSQEQSPQSSEAVSGSASSSSQASQASQSSEAASEPVSSSSAPSQAPQGSSESSKPEASPATNTTSESEGKVMVVYFSATGNTKAVAEVIANSTDGELYEIIPETPYTSENLDWTQSGSRSNKEHEDTSIRPAIAGDAKDLRGYDTIFIGYPLWWGEAPNIVWNFVESNNLKGKTVIPFATSMSSGFGSSGKTLEGMAPDANWLEGQRFRSGVAEADVQSWVNGLDFSPK